MHVFFCVSKNVSVSCAYTQGKREQFSGFNRTLDAINNVFRKFSAFHDETGRLNVDGMNIISNDGSNKLNRSRKARVSYKVQRTINASLNAATSTRAVSSNPNFRSEERFSRNAETDLVCRLLLEKKNTGLRSRVRGQGSLAMIPLPHCGSDQQEVEWMRRGP